MDKIYFLNTNLSIVSSNRVLYTPSSFAKSSLLHLQEIGELSALRAHTSSRSNLQSFLFFVVIKGSGTLIYDGKLIRWRRRAVCLSTVKTPTLTQQTKTISGPSAGPIFSAQPYHLSTINTVSEAVARSLHFQIRSWRK